MKLSVIIVSYNAPTFLRKCLISVLKELPQNSEIIVFDNASPNREIEGFPNELPEVKFVLNNKNLGFGKANNRAVEMAKGEFILLLNPDTIIYDKFFEKLFFYAKKLEKFGAIGVKMIDGRGNFLPESKRNVPSPLSSFNKLFSGKTKDGKSYYNTNLSENENGKVEVLSGACMLMKKDVFQEVNGFDERYFMYGEDIDLSYTLLQNGDQNYYLGEIEITHFKGESTIKDEEYLKRFYGAMEIFINKYYKKQSPLL